MSDMQKMKTLTLQDVIFEIIDEKARTDLSELATRLNTIANSTDEDLDQLSELVAVIKSNKDFITEFTTSKVSVADIIDNLTTNAANKPLSAAQGVALKALIDAIVVPTKTSELNNDSGFLSSYTETDPTVPDWAKASSKPTYTAGEVGAPTVDEMNAAIAAIPTPDVSGQINTHNASTEAHSDIRESISSLSSEKANANHTQSASTITAGTFAGQVIANASGQSPSVSCVRNSWFSFDESVVPTVEGETVWFPK